MRRGLDRVIEALLLVKLGQMLGSNTALARGVHDVIEAVLSATR